MNDELPALVQGASRGIGLALVEELLRRDPARPVIATSRTPLESPGLERLQVEHGERLERLALDVTSEESLARAAASVAERHPRLGVLMNVAGLLHTSDGVQPERRLREVTPERLRRSFEVNAFGPLLVAKHFEPLLCHGERAVLANLSARVGSIGDNRLGGWYAYRGSKAAQNMFTRGVAIEYRRRSRQAIVLALHPGTVRTDLSAPFRGKVKPEKLFEPERAARQLLDIVHGAKPEDSGSFIAWDGQPIPW